MKKNNKDQFEARIQRKEPYSCHKMITDLREHIETTYGSSYNRIDLEEDLRNLMDFLEKNKIDNESN